VTQMAKLRPESGDAVQQWQIEDPQAAQPRWYAVQVHVGSELHVLIRLANKEVVAFLPCSREKRKWSDRIKVVLVPLIPGYVFVRIAINSRLRLRTIETSGVHSFVQFGGVCPSIPDDHIEYLRRLSESSADAYAVPGVFCRGQKVRVRSGMLAGLEGTLLSHEQDRVMTVAIPAIQHSIRIAAADFDLEPI
jgi:transcription antitermination factor NusG